ncbi:MAG: hypothetical protein M0R49_02360 [Limnochordia bacterium]|nr:hypothetical protein [Limnochordia bacterium]
MDTEMLKKLEHVKNAPVAIDLSSAIMEQIEQPRLRHRFLVPATLGLLTIVTLAILLFPQMRKENLDRATEIAKPIHVINDYPRDISLYPNPYLNIDPEKLLKGGKNSL